MSDQDKLLLDFDQDEDQEFELDAEDRDIVQALRTIPLSRNLLEDELPEDDSTVDFHASLAQDSRRAGAHDEIFIPVDQLSQSTPIPASSPPSSTLSPTKKAEEEEVPVSWDRATFWRICRLAKPEIWLILAGLASLGVGSLSFLVLPYYAGQVIDSITNDNQSELSTALIVLGVLTLVGALAAFVRAACFTIAGERLVNRLRKEVFQKILAQDIAFFDLTRTGDLTNRLSSDCTQLRSAITLNVSMVLRSAFQSIGAIAVMFASSWKLTLVMLAVTPVLAVAAVIYGKYVRNLGKDVQDKLAIASTVAEEAIGNIRTVRSLSSEEFEVDRYGLSSDEAYLLSKKMGFASGGFAGLGAIFANIAIGGVLWYGGRLVISGEMSVGSLSSFLLYTLTVAVGIGMITAVWGDFMKAIGSSHRIFELLDREPKVRFRGGIVPSTIHGHIRFKNVSFAYPARPDTMVLKNLNLRLEPGKVVALVGKSGGGKSTCAALIEVFYTPTSGRIYFDGTDIGTIDRQFLTRHIAIVSQEPDLFATTIEENIAYGIRDEVSDEEIQLAARMANAHDFICQLEHGYKTQVGERGVRLSGGQKQRIAIARAIIRNPTVLLLDEATSALDAESEVLVQGALDKLLQHRDQSRTTLVIAHRLSTVQNADEVIVIQDGQAVERGTHRQLLALQGVYHNLVKNQLFAMEHPHLDSNSI